MSYILDACTLINLLHIDEDEFLLKKLRKLNFCIAPKVFKEVRDKAYEKVKLKSQKERNEYSKYLDAQIALALLHESGKSRSRAVLLKLQKNKRTTSTYGKGSNNGSNEQIS